MSPHLIAVTRGVLLASLFILVACSKDAVPTPPVTDAPKASGSSAPEQAAPSKMADGVVLTVSGPAFAEPQTFRIPGDSELLARSFDTGMFRLQLSSKAKVKSSNGTHVLDGLIVTTEPGGLGVATDETGVTNLWLSFSVDDGTPNGQSASMNYKPSKGDRQPVRIVTEAFEARERASGHFTGRVQRTNNKHRHEIYDVKGTFNLRED